jgi:hypothetical protein
MEKIIDVKIELCKDYVVGLACTFNIGDSIFTTYDHLMSYDGLIDNYRKALKKAEGFNMLTLHLNCRRRGDYSHYGTDVIKSYRLVNRYGDYEGSCFNGLTNSYDKFESVSMNKNFVEDIIKEYVALANSRYIQEIKSNASEQVNN